MKRVLLGFFLTFSGMIGAFISPFYGLCVYIWFAYMRTQEWMGNPGWFVSLRPSLLLAFCIISGCVIHQKKMMRWNIQTIFIVMLWCWIFVCHTQSINKVASAYWLDYFNKLMICGFLITGLVDSKEKLFLVLLPFIFGLAFHSGKAGLYGILRPGAKILQGPGGMLTDNNCFAMAFNMILPFIFITGSFFIRHKLIKLGFMAVFYLSILGVVFTYSRGGFLGLCGVLFLIGIRARKNIIKLGIYATISLTLIFVMLPQSYKDRIATIASSEKEYDSSTSGRLHFWRVALVMAKDNPIFGVGPGCYEKAYNRYDFSEGRFGKNKAVHNSFCQMLTNNGIPGLLLFLTLIFLNLYICHRWRKLAQGRPELSWIVHCANIFEISTVAYCISGFFLSMAYADLIYHLFFLVVALDKLAKEYTNYSTVIVLDSENDKKIEMPTKINDLTVESLEKVPEKTFANADFVILQDNEVTHARSWKNYCELHKKTNCLPPMLILCSDKSRFINITELKTTITQDFLLEKQGLFIVDKDNPNKNYNIEEKGLEKLVYHTEREFVIAIEPEFIVVDISVCSLNFMEKIPELLEYHHKKNIPLFFCAMDYDSEKVEVNHDYLYSFVKMYNLEEDSWELTDLNENRNHTINY